MISRQHISKLLALNPVGACYPFARHLVRVQVHGVVAVCAVVAMAVTVAPALALDPRFELDPKLLDKKVAEDPVKEKTGKEKERSVREVAAKERPAKETQRQEPSEGQTVTRTVKPGDHIFKILMRDYGLSNDEAERLIPEVKRLNKLDDIRRLTVGSTIILPVPSKGKTPVSVARSQARKPSRVARLQKDVSPRLPEPVTEPAVHQMTMMKLAPPPVALDAVDVVRQVWDKLLPSGGGSAAKVDVQDDNFSVSLDADKFPVLPTADGGRIVVDAQGALPPIVKSLLTEKDPGLRVVSENPANRRRFFSSLLAAANFYSVEEDFAVDFGADPKITVRADYKIERSPDSLLKHDVVLMNVTDHRRAMPDQLLEYLRQEGFNVVEAMTSAPGAPPMKNVFYSIRGDNPKEVADGLLKALSLRYEKEKNVELTGWESRGIKMFVKVDRYFEDRGERYAVTLFDGNPVNYTLTRLLETVGFKVIVLDPNDNFKGVAEKVVSRLKLQGRYGVHSLWSAADTPYSVQMSGLMLRNQPKGGGVFITDVPTSPLVNDLLTWNGYRVQDQQFVFDEN